MAQSVKPPAKSQHAGKSRKPITIDHVPLQKSTPQAEPIAIDEKQETPMSQTGHDKTTTASSNSQSRQDNKRPLENDKRDDARQAAISNSSKRGTGSLFVAGLSGGVVALILGAGLQWLGLLPFTSSDSTVQNKVSGLEEQFGNFKQQIADGVASTAQLSGEDRKAIDDVVAAVETLNAKTNDIGQQLASTNNSVATLNNTVNSIAAQNGDPQALDALSKKFDSVDQKLSAIDDVVQKTGKALSLSTKNSDDIKVLTQQMDDMKSQLSNPVQGKEIAIITAVNSLKSAVDRGGSYVNELQILRSVAPSLKGLDELQANAIKGLPNQAELATEFSHIADKIAATENQAAEDAGIGEQLWAGAKGLVSSRPIGDVEGDNPAAIAARMEVSIKNGDYEKALAEWQNLPQNAKDVSADFMQKLTLKRNTDALLSEALTSIMQPSTAKDQH